MTALVRRARASFNKLLASQERRAFTFTPPIALVLFVTFLMAANPFDYFEYNLERHMVFLILSPMWLPFAYLTIGVIYVPVHRLFRRLNHRSLPAVMTVSATASVICYTVPDLFLFVEDGTSYANCIAVQENEQAPCEWQDFWNHTTLWGVYGGVCGAVFWFIYAGGLRLRLRPDEPWT